MFVYGNCVAFDLLGGDDCRNDRTCEKMWPLVADIHKLSLSEEYNVRCDISLVGWHWHKQDSLGLTLGLAYDCFLVLLHFIRDVLKRRFEENILVVHFHMKNILRLVFFIFSLETNVRARTLETSLWCFLWFAQLYFSHDPFRLSEPVRLFRSEVSVGRKYLSSKLQNPNESWPVCRTPVHIRTKNANNLMSSIKK